jgi:hypothetical protein
MSEMVKMRNGKVILGKLDEHGIYIKVPDGLDVDKAIALLRYEADN